MIQIRTGKIGLRGFLHRRGVPAVPSPLCSCVGAPETAEHLIIRCPETEEAREQLVRAVAPEPLRSRRDLEAILRHPLHAQTVVRWFLRLGRLTEYRLALQIGGESKARRP